MKTINYLTNLWRKVKAISDVQSRDEKRISGRVNPKISSTSVRLDSLSVLSRQSDLCKFAMRVAAMVCLLIMVGVGNVWSDETLTINYYSFSNHGTSYSDKTWYATSSPSSNAISGSANVCFYNYKDSIGMKNNHPAFRNTCALPGAIKSIKLTRQNGSNREVTVYVGTTALDNSNYSSSGTSLGTKQVTTSGVTWSLTSAQIEAGYKYFYFHGSSSALYLDNAAITYASCGGTQLDVPEVTATPASGQVQLTWPAVDHATKYQVSWDGGAFTDATSPYTKTSLTNGTSYTWAVKAIGDGSTYCESPAFEGSTKPGSTLYTITWKVYGESDQTTKVASGDHLVLPVSPSSCAVGTEFVGWSATNIGGAPTDTKPTFVSSQTTISSNQTYYAVFATRTANSYTKGDINDLFPGQTTLIVNVTNNKALSDEYVSGYQDKELAPVAVTISSDKITSMSNSHLIWTVENRGQKFNFKTGTGYLRATAAGNTKLSCNSGADPWTLTSAGTKIYYMNSRNSGASRIEFYNTWFTTYGTNATGTEYQMSFFVPTYTQYFTSCASCTEDPTINNVTISSAFKLTALSSTGSAVSVSSSGDPGTDCEWTDYGVVWSATNPPTVSHNKKVVASSGKAGSFGTSFMPSGSTTPTAWVVGTPYYVRTYGKNSKDGAAYVYSASTASFTLRSITFHSNGGSAVGPWYVNSGGTYEAPTAPTKDGFIFGGWYTDDGTFENPVNWSAAVSENKDYYARWFTYGDYVFSCAELTLTPKLVTANTPIFITSTVGDNWVRSADSILVEGSGLSASQTVTFTLSDPSLSDVFRVRKKDFTELTTGTGTIPDNTYVYIFYKPAAGSTSDGLDKLTSITATVGGGKPKTVTLAQSIMGRHLPAKFVIAAKNTTDGKWYALPNPATTLENPTPVEIAVNNATNPTAAYTATSNVFSLCGQDEIGTYKLSKSGEWVKLGMPNNDNYPLFGSTEHTIKSDNSTTYTGDIGKQYWWQLVQTYTGSITNAKQAKYTIKSANNSYTLSAWWNAAGGPKWGLYAAGNGEHTLRLIPASSYVFAEAEVVEWGQHGFVIEVDAQGIDATSVVGTLGSTSSSAITLVQTGTSKGSSSKYTYTVNFGATFDFADAANNGALLRLAWKKGSTTKAMSNVTIPKIIAADNDMTLINATASNWAKWEVHVLPGVTLTANAGDFTSSKVTIKHLEIYPGATVKVTEGAAASGTLTTTALVLRNGWTTTMSSNTKSYDVARLHVATTTTLKHTNAYLDWYIDYDQFYPIGVPWPVATSTISYRNTSSAASAGVKIRHYDGSQRASSGKLGDSWVEYTWGGTMPTNLAPSTGYALAAKRPKGKAFSIVRMPLTFADTWTTSGEQGNVSTTHKDQVSVSQNSGSLDWYTQGWNFVANPYMANFSGNVDGVKNSLVDQQGKGIKYATIPDTDFQNFEQVNITSSTLKPSSGFFVQVASNTTLTFSNSGIIAPSAPARYTNEPEAIPDQEADIQLSSESGAKDQMGLIIGWDYTADYEINADLAKIIGGGDALKTYMQYGGTDMAYVAINEVLAREWIPVTVYIPVEGEYTYSLMNSSMVDALEGVYLIDYEADGKVTNLLYDTYTFTAEAGTFDKRFAINAIVGDHKVPTSADIAGLDKNATGPIKFIWHDRVYILHNGVIYDSTGKRVNVINK